MSLRLKITEIFQLSMRILLKRSQYITQSKAFIARATIGSRYNPDRLRRFYCI